MRGVAQAAHTTTPTIYRRFKNRQEILRALLRRIQQEVLNVLRTCRSPQEASQRYVELATSMNMSFILRMNSGLSIQAASVAHGRPDLQDPK